MKINQLLFFSIFSIGLIGVFTPSKIAAQTNCESYLDCNQTAESLEKIDYWTNYFFKLLRPEMRHKRIRTHHLLYRRESAEIRRVVNKIVRQSCQQPHRNQYYLLSKRGIEPEEGNLTAQFNPRSRMRTRMGNNRSYSQPQDNYKDRELVWDEELWNEGYYWKFTEDYFFEGLYRDLTDAVFYARHPELSREISIKNNINWSTEWTFIRQHFANFEEEKFLKQHLVPLCKSNYN